MESERGASSPRRPEAIGAARRPARPACALVGLGVALIAAMAVARSRTKPLWYDELFSFYLAGLPRFADVWAALADGTDLNPPLHYAVVRGMFALLGKNALALRLPSIFGYAVMTVCLYSFAARRLRPAFACAAAAFPLITPAFAYAYEGRPYGMVLGFSGLALVGWQAAAEGPRRGIGILVLAASLAAAVSTHFFGVLIFVPIGMGELARAWSRRKVDRPVGLALVVGLSPLLFFRELIAASSQYKGIFWAKPSLAQNVAFYRTLLRDTEVPLFVLLGLLTIGSRVAARPRAGDVDPPPTGGREPVPPREWAAMAVLFALPVIGFFVAKLASGGSFTERYALPAVLGFGLLTAYAGDRFSAGRAACGVAMTLSFLGWFLMNEGYRLGAGPEAQKAIAARDFARAGAGDLPVVISRSLMFLQAHHDLPPRLSDRLVFVSQGRSTDERALSLLSRRVPIKVVEEARFLDEHDRFFLCGYPGDPVFRSLLEGTSTLTMLHARRYREGEAVLVRVDRGRAPTTTVAP